MTRSNLLQNWNVYTDDSSSERGGKVFIGTHYGYVDDIALRLAKRQQGFWCAGKLHFEKADPPRNSIPNKRQEKVNVVVKGHDWFSSEKLKKARSYFKGRPVEVQECNLYGAVTLVAKKKRK